MEKERNTRLLSVLAICLAVIGMTVGFAAFSTTLNIEGTANVLKSSWEVKFQNLQTVALTGDAEEVTAPTINNDDTTISTYAVNLKTPGDAAAYKFQVTNTGTFDAKLSTISIPEPRCTGKGDNAQTDATNVCGKLTYTLTYADGQELAEDDALAVGQTEELLLTLSYADFEDATLLPKDDVAISNLNVELVYIQD